MPRKEHHVGPNPDDGWDVKREHAQRSSGHFDTKKEAIEAGRRISTNQGTELIPHRKDGTIQNPNSHGNDPYPPKISNTLQRPAGLVQPRRSMAY